MASRAFELLDELLPTRERPALRLVEPQPAPRQLPPAWLVAPAFREPIAFGVREEQQPHRAASANGSDAPYRNSRDVPRH